MNKTNKVYIGASIDGYIADRNGGLDWLDSIPNPDGDDMGYFDFMKEIDALVMGRKTFETVIGFDIDWPYNIPVFVLSNTLEALPEDLTEKVFLVNGSLTEILAQIHAKGCYRLYIDGGITIQNFLKADLIDEMIITTIPILLGGGASLFSDLPQELQFDLMDTKLFCNQITQHHYKRKRD